MSLCPSSSASIIIGMGPLVLFKGLFTISFLSSLLSSTIKASAAEIFIGEVLAGSCGLVDGDGLATYSFFDDIRPLEEMGYAASAYIGFRT